MKNPVRSQIVLTRFRRSGVAAILSVTVACSSTTCGSPKPSPPVVAAVPIDATLEVPVAVTTAPAELRKGLDAALARYSDVEFNPDAKAKALGPDVPKIFAFVRDEIQFESYSGVLRGAYGAMTARAGNSLDRSLLLARLLAGNGVQVRFAAGDLPLESAKALYAHIFDGFVPLVLDDAGSANTFLKRLVTRARRDYPVIQTAIGPSSAAAASKAREQALIDIQRHVWIQANINGQWQDLDSAFPDAVPGRSYAAAKQTLEQLPAEWHQRVVIRVMAERLDGGALTTSEAFTLTAQAVDLLDETVFIAHAPTKRSGGGMGLTAGSTAGADEWTPTLIVGDTVQAGQSVNFGEAGGSGMLDAFGGGDSSTFVAEWLELEVVRPDGRRDLTRRVLADRASAAWRAAPTHDPAALRPLERDQEGLFAPRALHNLLFSAGPHDLSAFVRSVAWCVSDGNPAADAPPGLRLFPLALMNFTALMWSDHLIIPAINDAASFKLYADSPRVFIVSHIPMAGGQGLQLYDLRRDRLLGVARDTASDSIVGDRKLRFTALEGALEHEAVARDATLLDGDPSAVLSTSSQLGKDGVVTLRTADLKRIQGLTTDADKVARLTRALQGGNTVVVPRATLQSGPLAYWEISENGDARAVAGTDLDMSAGYYNPIPRPAPARGIVYDIGRPGFKGGGSQGGSGRAGTEYVGIVIVVVDLISATTLLSRIVRQRIDSARIELETEQLIEQARARQRAAGGS